MENKTLWSYGDPVQLLEQVDYDSYVSYYEKYVVIDNKDFRYYESMQELVEKEKGMYLTLVPYQRDNYYCYLELEKESGSKVIIKLPDFYVNMDGSETNYIINMSAKYFDLKNYLVDYDKITKRLKEEFYTDKDLKQEYNNIFHNTKGFRVFVDNVVESYVDFGQIFLDKDYYGSSWLKVDGFIVDCDNLYTWFMEELEELKRGVNHYE